MQARFLGGKGGKKGGFIAQPAALIGQALKQGRAEGARAAPNEPARSRICARRLFADTMPAAAGAQGARRRRADPQEAASRRQQARGARSSLDYLSA
jgi:hypothetical protein